MSLKFFFLFIFHLLFSLTGSLFKISHRGLFQFIFLSILGVFLGFSPFAFAKINIKKVLGVSYYSIENSLLQSVSSEDGEEEEEESQKIKIYGGSAGPKCHSDDMDNINPCSNCNTALGPCNEKRIYPELRMRIIFSIDSEMDSMALSLMQSDDNKNITIDNQSETLTNNTDLFVDVTWSDLCSILSNDNTCNTAFHKTIILGIQEEEESETEDSSTDTEGSSSSTLDTLEAKASLSIYLVPGKDGQELHSNCASEEASDYEGFCHFSVFPGDKKVFIENLKYPTTFPETHQADVSFKFLRVYYQKDTMTQRDSPIAAGFSALQAPLEETLFQDLLISQSNKNPVKNTVNGLENDSWYYFRIASVDEAGNILYFSPSNYLNTNAHTARPLEVVGFLEENSCFIATATYDSAMAKETVLFKKFRDLYLKKSSIGRFVIKNYYHYSPPLAKWIKKKEKRKKWVRVFLWPLLAWIKGYFHFGLWITLGLTILLSLIFLWFLFRIKRIAFFILILFAFIGPMLLMADTNSSQNPFYERLQKYKNGNLGTKKKKLKISSSIQGVNLSSPQKKDVNSLSFKDIYSKDKVLSGEIGFQYFLLSNDLGKWGLGISGGVGFIDGKGRFKKNLQISKEKYKLFIFPLSLSATYRLQFYPKQWVAPYVSAGPYYLGFLESRSEDNKQYKGSLLGYQVTGGLLFSLRHLLPKYRGTSSHRFQNLWLQVSLQQVEASNEGLNLSDTLMAAGFILDLDFLY